MKKITILLFALFSFKGISQSKSTGAISLNNGVPITANFTLNNTTSQVTLILTGPSDRWFGLGIGIAQGFGMASGDVLVYANTSPNALTDRNFSGTGTPPQDTQDWTTVSDIISGTSRTLTLTRALTNSDPNDFQFPYAATNSISIGGVRASSANNMTVGAHGGSASAGYATGTLTLGAEDFSLNSSVIFPNPSNGEFSISTKTILNKVNIYSQTGALVKTIEVINNSNEAEVKVNGLTSGIYFIELLNDSEKSWKKIIVE
ncbi:T9SS type A sorting domain-containing protein [Flavobacterium sp.]|jgi:hypothetical protein|uniref:T9SS type A sorting domain-containing protein n=1 Tax=Flavobacterium sp. TaxID=239 RepID=UPI0037C0A7D9